VACRRSISDHSGATAADLHGTSLEALAGRPCGAGTLAHTHSLRNPSEQDAQRGGEALDAVQLRVFAHQANAPDFAGQRAEPGADFNAVLIQ